MNLIFDRTQADVTYAAELNRKLGRGEALTSQELADWNAGLKGAYNATDMNRVDAAVREIGAKLTAASYPVRYTSPVPPPEPEYTPLSYIESSGTQYIDTGYKPNNNTKVVLKASIISPNPDYTAVFGARTGETNQFWVYYSTRDAKWGVRYGSQMAYIDGTYTGDKNINCNRNIFSVDSASHTFSAQTYQTPYTMYLFAANDNGRLHLPGAIRYYWCQIYDNGILVRDYIPAMQNSIIGLYDKVEQKIYGNSGTGDFIAGEVVPQPEPEPEPTKTEFEIGDIITYSIWRTYLDNVQALRDAYYTMPDTPKLPEPTAPLGFDGANAIEKLLYDVQILYNAMSASYRKCGTFQSGTNSQRLPLQRSVT